jgi:hypothetical protein
MAVVTSKFIAVISTVVTVIMSPVTMTAVTAAPRVGNRNGGNRGNQSKEYSGNKETHCLIHVRFKCEVKCYGDWRWSVRCNAAAFIPFDALRADSLIDAP